MRTPDYIHIPSRLDSIAMVLSEDERRAGHGDHVARGRLLADIGGRRDALALSWVETHGVVGLPPGSLGDGSVPTPALRDALSRLNALHRVRP